MDYSEFAKKAIMQDKRNVFSEYSGNLDAVPNVLKAFYKEHNPSDVEINYVHFSSAEELVTLQEEHSYLNAQFVFATCNGDPIFLHDGCVYTSPHGVKNPKWELLAKDIKAYFSSLFFCVVA